MNLNMNPQDLKQSKFNLSERQHLYICRGIHYYYS